MKSFDAPTDELVDQTLLSLKRELERNYFYGKLENPLWIAPLEKRGVFQFPPKTIQLENGMQWPFWPEMEYLLRMASVMPEDVVRIADAVPQSDNPRVYHELLQVALAIKDVALSVKLLDQMIVSANASRHLIGGDFAKLLRHWIAGGEAGIAAALKLAPHLIGFRPDPRQKEKIAERKEHPSSYLTRLEPAPKFDSWEYLRILDEGIRPLGLATPIETGKILIKAIAHMIRLRFHPDESGERQAGEDISTIWCRRINGPASPHLDTDEALVHSLTFTLEAALTSSLHDNVKGQVFELLTNTRWNIFSRIGNYLASLRPLEARNWIRMAILDFKGYSNSDYSPEFVQMVRAAAEQGNPGLLSEAELAPIFEAILSGPNEQRFRDFMGQEFTDELFAKRKRHFHKTQLWPFEAFLFGKYKGYFSDLCAEGQTPTLQKYGPSLDMGGAKVVESQSPIAKEELARKSDQEIIKYLNEWNDSHHDAEKWWIEIDHRGLSLVFQSLIAEDPNRFAKWDAEWKSITRPVFFRAAMDAAIKHVEQKNRTHLADWFRLSTTLASFGNQVGEERKDLSSHSDTQPDWDWARRGIDSFLHICMAKDTAVPVIWRKEIAELITQLATAYDSTLDQKKEVFVGTYDPIGTAINTTRGQALERITDFVNWVGIERKANAFDQVPEMTELLAARFGGNPPLTEPEYAILGETFNRFFYWDSAWAKENLRSIFVRDESLRNWRAAFGTYLQFGRAYGEAYSTLKDDYALAMEHMDFFRKGEKYEYSAAEAVGHHLLAFHIGEQFPLSGPESPLETFYQVATTRERAGVLNHLGRSLVASADLKADILERCRMFFEYRLSVAEINHTPESVEEFTTFEPWTQAKVFDPVWRLQIIRRVLNLKGLVRSDLMLVESLNEMLPENVALVVECFHLLISNSKGKDSFYVSKEEALPILKAGLASSDETVRANALKAQDDLLRAGRFEFLDITSDEPSSKG
jgi:hypothetical protein